MSRTKGWEHWTDGTDHEPGPNMNGALPPIDQVNDLLAAKEITLPPEIISGLLHQCTKGVIGSASKARKTWILLDLATSIATGRKFWKFPTAQTRVLYTNFEIPRAFIRQRLLKLTEAKEISDLSLLDVWTLRGHAAPFGALLPELAARIKERNYGLILIDPVYKGLGGRDENATGAISELMNELERLAVDTGAAVLFAAHFSKGNQSAKEHLDRISGSGVFARDPDSIVTLTKHESPDCYTVDLTLRNLPESPPFVVEWKFPLMVERPDLDPEALKQAKTGGRAADYKPEELLAVLAERKEATTAEWKTAAADELGMARTTFFRLLESLRKSGRAVKSKLNGKWIANPMKTP